MKINFIKMPGGLLQPANDIEAKRMERLKSGHTFEIDIKQSRNQGYHGKMFSFFTFCFEYWRGGNEFQDDKAQFDEFRKGLTIQAGFYNQVFNLDGEVSISAKSLSFESMEQEEFESCCNAMMQAALNTVFVGADQNTINRLYNYL